MNEKRFGAAIAIATVRSKIRRMMRDGMMINGPELLLWLRSWAARTKKRPGGL